MTREFVLAHVSDLHIGPLIKPPLRLLNLKRAMGAANWQRARRRIHDADVAERVIAHVRGLGVDHIAISGDICNLGLPDEHAAALDRLRRWGSGDSISVVPGNHDIYSQIGSDPGTERWRPYMTSCARGLALGGSVNAFPFVRVFGGGEGEVALIGVNSAIMTPPLRAHGLVGAEQMAALEACLLRAGEARLGRVVMLHHPPLVALGHKRKALLDAAAFEAMLRRAGADLVIYGHNHQVDLRRMQGLGGAVVVAGIASGSAAVVHGPEPAARLALYRVAGASGAVTVEIHGLDPVSGKIGRLSAEEHVSEHR